MVVKVALSVNGASVFVLEVDIFGEHCGE